jgi:hypothetical protein
MGNVTASTSHGRDDIIGCQTVEAPREPLLRHALYVDRGGSSRGGSSNRPYVETPREPLRHGWFVDRGDGSSTRSYVETTPREANSSFCIGTYP